MSRDSFGLTPSDLCRAIVLAGAVFLLLPSAAGQVHGCSTPPRTSWGDPDLQGTYSNKNESGTPLERPAPGPVCVDKGPGNRYNAYTTLYISIGETS